MLDGGSGDALARGILKRTVIAQKPVLVRRGRLVGRRRRSRLPGGELGLPCALCVQLNTSLVAHELLQHRTAGSTSTLSQSRAAEYEALVNRDRKATVLPLR